MVDNYVYITALTGNLLSFICGSALSWPSTELPKFFDNATNPLNIAPTEAEVSWIVSCMPLGSIFGPFIFGHLADRIGRKYSMLCMGVVLFIGYAILTFSNLILLFYYARFTIGLVVGSSYIVITIYLIEISEDRNRGAISSSANIFNSLGMLFSYSIGPYVSSMLLNALLTLSSAIFLILFLTLAPETPYYYVKSKQTKKALESLSYLRSPLQNLDNELEKIKLNVLPNEKPLNLPVKSFIICFFLVIFQQMTGINEILFFAQEIFVSTNISFPPELCAIIIGLAQFLASFIPPFLSDKLGRKILLISSAVGMTASHLLFAVFFLFIKDSDVNKYFTWLPLFSQILFVVTFTAGFEPIPWTILGELFQEDIKFLANAIISVFMNLIEFLFTNFFFVIKDEIGFGGIFLIFASFCVLAAFYSAFCIVETKGKSLKEIQNELHDFQISSKCFSLLCICNRT